MTERRHYVFYLNDDSTSSPPVGELQAMAIARAERSSPRPRLTGLESTSVLVGTEAFADWSVLPSLIEEFAAAAVTPVFLTRGNVPASEKVICTALSVLAARGPFKMMFVADGDILRPDRFAAFSTTLRAARRTLRILPEVLLLTGPDDASAIVLLDSEEVNKNTIVYPRSWSNLTSYLKHTSVDINSIDHGTVLRKTRTDEHPATGRYDLSFNSLVIETTHFCNARCSHCYTSCGPDSPKTRLGPNELRPVIEDASKIPSIGKTCHVGGGEATIYWKELIEIFEIARSCGFENSLVTNGYWGKNATVADSKVAQLKNVGVAKIEFSIDAMHQEYVNPTVISNVIRACKNNNVRIVLRICTTKTNRASNTVRLIERDVYDGVVIGISRTTPVGRAATAIDREDLWLDPGIPIGACFALLNLTITPDGNVYPCCAGSETCPSLSLGNVRQQRLQEIIAESKANFLVRTLVHAGPAYFAALLQEAGLGHRLRSEYTNFCHLCNDICSDFELMEVVSEKLRGRVRGQLLELLVSAADAERACATR